MIRTETTEHALAELVERPNDADALLELGLRYCSGRQVGLDLIEAHKWFNLAALRGNSEARRYRSEIAAELSRAEIGDAQRRAREWLKRH